ncbi:protein kinase, partial [Streptomyces sp. NRRL WC-3549]|uniref:protein kinase n=1 Tax=Streptomyces sp. NRRL WC-3549 TaxID=1463925 RepID=UPI001F2340B2
RRATGRTVRRSTDPAVRRAIEAAQAAAQVPDHPRLDQVFDVFAEAGSLWIVSELVAARPLAALLAERPLNPYRAAEIGSDVLTALRVLHAHGWTHRNITVRTVLVCDDGRAVLTGLAAGAAEEALCGYMPVPQPDDEGEYGPPAVESGPTGPYEEFPGEESPVQELPGEESPVQELPGGESPVQDFPGTGLPAEGLPGAGLPVEGLPFEGLPVVGFPVEDEAPELPEFVAERPVIPPGPPEPAERPVPSGLPESSGQDGPDAPPSAGVPASRGHLEIEPPYRPPGPQADGPAPERQELVPRPAHPAVPLAESRAEPGAGSAAHLRAARAGAIAAYRAGARAAVRAGEDQQGRDGAVPAGPPAPGAGPGRGSASFDPGGGSGFGPAEGRSWDRAPGPADGSGDGTPDGPGGTGPGGPRAGAGRGDGGAVPGARSGSDAVPAPGDRTEQGGGSGYDGPAPGAEAGGAEGFGGIPGPAGPGAGAGSGGGPGVGGAGGRAVPHGGRPVTGPPAGPREAGPGEAGPREVGSRETGPGEAGPGGPGAAPSAPRADRASDGARTDGGSASGDGSAASGQGVPVRPRLTGAWGRPAAELPFHGAFADDGLYDDADDDPFADDEDDEGPDGPLPPGRRVFLAGTWDDGPESGRPVPAGGSPGGFGRDELRADSRRGPDRGDGRDHGRGDGPGDARGGGRGDRLPQPVGARAGAGGWGEVVAGSGDTPAYRGPATPLAAERARQARIAVVGPVTERWAPEQAGPVHDNWQLAPPIGPSTDLWALGALLYRAVQGHAPYPEENAAELVQMVCGEPPAFAEECGPLRPVVESLLRQDPTERPDFEELRGWLRSLIRSAPEPEAGDDVVPLPPTDAARLPVVRRRGELVRRRRGRGAAHGRHRQGKRQRLEA